ncbi:peptidase M24 [Lentinus brumalis]|uniref:Peptidase M24 n=1 Tax=Lentinus brumalis TaxID=2498619 RepID=A0A371DVN0_9APHY|nr:peptidase M24 [Polyporus brumalis]
MSLEKLSTNELRVVEETRPLEPSVRSKTPLRHYLWVPLLVLALGFESFHVYLDWVAPTTVQLRQIGPDFSHLASHCAHIPAISPDSFLARQDALARTLHSLNVAAYIAEPGASAGFFANLSRSHWGLSERPLLLIIQPQTGDEGTVRANVSILTPAFEETRARTLPIPSDAGVTYTSWAEDANPFSTALNLVPDLADATIYVDGDVRTFITDGLQKAAPEAKVLNAPVEVKRLRERKSSEELDIMKCVNEVTVLAIRAVRKHTKIGMRESEVKQLMRSALSAAGLTDIFSLVLFGDNAALPHGGGSDRVLGKHDFILIDTGGALHGYHSDTTRTFALDTSAIPLRYQALWQSVHSAQRHAMLTARNGTVTAAVDHAARKVIKEAGYGQYFTHRLGHGIGLEVHESPYLRGGSDDIILSGHAFSNEPGIYIEGKVGVRLEDCFYIDDDGDAKYLTEGVGGQASSPWSP